MNINDRLVLFIAGYMVGCLTYSLLMALSIWILIQSYGNRVFVLVSLLSLVIVFLLTARWSHFLDKYSRKKLVLIGYLANGLALSVGLSTGYDAIAALWIVAAFQLSINVFYSSYYALAQLFADRAYQRLNTLLEICGQLSAVIASVIIYFMVPVWGAQRLLWLVLALLVLAGILLTFFCESCLLAKIAQPVKVQRKTLSWFWAQPITWLSMLGIFPYLIIMGMNQIQPIYFYQLMKLQPDDLAVSSMCYVAGTMLGSYWAAKTDCCRCVIVRAFVFTLLVTLILAIYPVQMLFYVAMLLFGLLNSSSRIAMGSLTMETLPNHQMGTYSGLRSNVAFTVRLGFMLALTGLFPIFDYRYAIWLLPAVVLYVPVVSVLLRCFKVG